MQGGASLEASGVEISSQRHEPEDYSSPEKELYRLRIVKHAMPLGPDASILMMPGPRMIEIDHYPLLVGTDPANIHAVEHNVPLARRIQSAYPRVQVYPTPLRVALSDMFDKGVRIQFAHLDLMDLATNLNTRQVLRRLILWCFDSGKIAVNWVNGRDQVENRVDYIEQILRDEQLEREVTLLETDKYNRMEWAIWSVQRKGKR